MLERALLGVMGGIIPCLAVMITTQPHAPAVSVLGALAIVFFCGAVAAQKLK